MADREVVPYTAGDESDYEPSDDEQDEFFEDTIEEIIDYSSVIDSVEITEVENELESELGPGTTTQRIRDTLRDNNQIGLGQSTTPENVVISWEENRGPEEYNDRFMRHKFTSNFTVKHNMSNFENLFEVEAGVDRFYDEFMTRKLNSVDPEAFVSVTIDHEELNGKPIYVPPFQKMNYEKESFFNSLYTVAQSNKSFLLNGEFRIIVNITKPV